MHEARDEQTAEVNVRQISAASVLAHTLKGGEGVSGAAAHVGSHGVTPARTHRPQRKGKRTPAR